MACLGLAATLLAGPALAHFPDGPITLVVASSAGGGVDASARLIGVRISEALRQPVVIENRPGAYSRIASGIVAKAPPDGHWLLVITATAAIDIAVDPTARPNALQDFVPVTTIAMTDLVLVVNPALPIRSVQELLVQARASPGKLNFATPGARTTYHLEGELFKLRTGVDIVHVPFKGLVPALQSLMSGDVEMSFSSLPAALPFINAGSVRALAVTSPARSPLLPGVPTMKEAGVDGVDTTAWYGILAPAGTPGEVVATLAQAIRDVSQSVEYRRSLLNIGATPFVTTPAEFDTLLRSEIAKWARIIKSSQVPIE